MTFSISVFSAFMLSVIMLNVVMLSVIMLNVVMLSVIMLIVVMLSVIIFFVVVPRIKRICLSLKLRARPLNEAPQRAPLIYSPTLLENLRLL